MVTRLDHKGWRAVGHLAWCVMCINSPFSDHHAKAVRLDLCSEMGEPIARDEFGSLLRPGPIGGTDNLSGPTWVQPCGVGMARWSPETMR